MGVKPPDPPTSEFGRILIWAVVLLTLAGIVFVFGILGYFQLRDGKSADVLFALATAAAGAIIGLLAPSPPIR